MAWRETVDEILRQCAPTAADRLGGGDEAEVYAVGPERVIRFYKELPNCDLAKRRRDFYATLDSTRVAFRVPAILDEDERDGVYYTVEQRIAGVSLAEALPTLAGTARRQALRGYAETSLAVRSLGCPQQGFGEILTPSPIRTDTWSDFILSRASRCLEAQYPSVVAQMDRPDRALRQLEFLLAQCPCSKPELVHGDYYPANVMIDLDGHVTGLIDFGALTVMGDARMDAAGAVLYLTAIGGIATEDKRIVLDCVKEHGIDDAVLALYRIFYAFRFLATDREGVLRWCIETLRWACGQASLA
jgi:Phosphotransferase enzyme family